MAAIRLGAKVLDQVQNVGQVAELCQSHVHQREQVYWTKRAYHIDSQSIRLDALDHAKEEIRSHYDTYVGQIDTMLLVLALIWPFALNTIQFSDAFIPGQQPESECFEGECIETVHPPLLGAWIGLTAIILILPFWGILMLIRCKMKLDNWLEYSLSRLRRERKRVVRVSQPHLHSEGGEPPEGTMWSWDPEREAEMSHDDETEQLVFRLVNVVMKMQEYLAEIWKGECAWLVHASTMLLWMSAVAALLLTSLSLWIFLKDKGGTHAACSPYFLGLILLSIIAPGLYIFAQNFRSPPVYDPDVLRTHAYFETYETQGRNAHNLTAPQRTGSDANLGSRLRRTGTGTSSPATRTNGPLAHAPASSSSSSTAEGSWSASGPCARRAPLSTAACGRRMRHLAAPLLQCQRRYQGGQGCAREDFWPPPPREAGETEQASS